MDESLHYLTQNLADLPDSEDWLSEKERTLLSRLRVPKRRNDWKLGRWTAKRAYITYKPEQPLSMPGIDVIAAEDGSPDIHFRGKPAPVSISISHSRDLGFCVLAPENLTVGCDLEWMEYESPGFFDDYFRPEETQFCREALETIKPIAGYLIWSAKESCLKVLREGLRRDTRSVRIDLDPRESGGSWKPWTGHCMKTGLVFHGWWQCKDGFVYTIASDQPGQPPRELQL